MSREGVNFTPSTPEDFPPSRLSGVRRWIDAQFDRLDVITSEHWIATLVGCLLGYALGMIQMWGIFMYVLFGGVSR